MKQSHKIAYGGMMTAFSLLVMLASNFIPSLLFAFPAAAGIVIYTLSFVSGHGYGWISFAAVALLSLFLCTDKTVAVCFILFLGYYPLLKKTVEKLRSKVLTYLIKLLAFNAAAACSYALLTFVFSVQVFTKWLSAAWMVVPLIIGLNFVFLLYDFCLTLFFRKYEEKIYNLVTKLLRRF